MSDEPIFHLNLPFDHERTDSMSSMGSVPSVEEETNAFLEQAAEIALDLKQLSPQFRFFKSRQDIVSPFEWSVGWDLFTLPQFHCTIPPGESRLIPLGIAFGFPKGYYGQLFSKSGLAFQHGLYVQGGVLEPDYDGDINVLLHNFGKRPFHVRPVMVICQMILLRYQDTVNQLQEVSNIKQLRNRFLIPQRVASRFGGSGAW